MNTLLGQRIREQRKEKGWTIEQFAERVELSANYVGDLERGVKIPKLETFIRIVEVLDVSADVLIRDSVLPGRIRSDWLLPRVLPVFRSCPVHGSVSRYGSSSQDLRSSSRCATQ